MKNKNKFEGIKSSIKKLPDSEVEIICEASFELLSDFRAKAINELGKELEVPGFRKGKAPEKFVVEKFGELVVLEESAEFLIQEAYPHLIEVNSLDPIGTPKVSITKIGAGAPIEFKISTAVMPITTMPDYKKISKKWTEGKKEVVIEDKEIDEALQKIKQNVAHAGHKHEDGKCEATETDIKIDDDFAKKLGASSLDDLRNKITDEMLAEKKNKEIERVRIGMMEEIAKEMKCEVPKVLVDSETNMMFLRFKNDIEGMGIKLEDYFAKLGKKQEDLMNDWKEDAKKKVLFELALATIAKNENLRPDETKINEEVEHILSYYKDADPVRARGYVYQRMLNEEVFHFLEGSEKLPK